RADQLGRDLVDAAREEVSAEGHSLESYRSRLGIAARIATAPAAHAIPPETIEKRRLVSEARTPASTFPSAGVLATCASSKPCMRPRIGSGVPAKRIVE